MDVSNNPRIHVQEEGWEPRKIKETSDVGTAFRNIKLSMCQLVFDPPLGCLCCPFRLSMPKSSLTRSLKLADKCEERLKDDLDVTNLLKKVKDSHAMLQHLVASGDKDLLKYHKGRVIGLDESEESPEEDGAELKVEKLGELRQILGGADSVKLSLIEGASLPTKEREDLIKETFRKH